jgi:hypothetical protein
MMKMRLILLAMAVAFAGSAAQAAPVLYVHYDFDDPQTGSTISDESTNSFTGTYEVGNTASAINSGPAGPVTGPTGLAGDYALPGIQNGAPGNSAVDMLQNGTSSFPTNSGAAGILKSFTFTFWFKGDITSSSGSAGRVYEARRGTPNNQTTLLFYNSTTGTDYFQANIGASGVMTSSTDAYSETNEWIFVAFTADANTDVYKFYKGTTSSSVSLVTSNAIPGIEGNGYNYPGWAPAQTAGGITDSLVANGTALNRRLGVALDDFRIYGAVNHSSDGALSQSELESIRLTTIPEPSTMLTVLLGAGLVAMRRKLRR